MREFAYVCLDCDKVFYVSSYWDGERLCPRCAGRAHVPLRSILPPLAGGAPRPLPPVTGRVAARPQPEVRP